MITGRKPGRAAPERIDSLGFLEVLWGDGCRLPGGAGAVRGVLRDLDLRERTVLELGCAAGGTSCALVTDYGARRVTGVDTDPRALARGRQRIWSRGLAGCVRFVEAGPAPLPLPDAAFDVAFAQGPLPGDERRPTLFADLWRMLRPGGSLVIGDWLVGRDREPSAELERWRELEGRPPDRTTPEQCRQALETAGFADIDLVDQIGWYREIVRDELALLEGPLGREAAAVTGPGTLDHTIRTWHALTAVLASGELRPHHIRARKPAAAGAGSPAGRPSPAA